MKKCFTNDYHNRDGTRKFAVIGTAGSCAAHKAWMMALDPGGSTTCPWDNTGSTRPYFLYSNSTTVSFCETGNMLTFYFYMTCING